MINRCGVCLYIDPGTGSMLFAVVMGIVATLVFAFQGLFIKIKSSLGVKRNIEYNNKKLDIVIYSDHKHYWNVFKPICDEFEKRKININYWTQSNDDYIFNENYKYIKSEYIGEGNKGFAKLNVMNAKVCLSTTPGLDVYQWKKSKNVNKYIHIFHSISLAIEYRMFGLDFYDTILVVNNFQEKNIRELENKRNLNNKDIYTVGVTYLDEELKRINKININKNVKKNPVVLVAPSWGDSSLLNVYKDKIIDFLIDTGYEIIVRPHPQMKFSNKKLLDDLMKKYNNIEWNFDVDNFEVLNKSDIMISDFSGVMVDYALVFDKPIIYTENIKDHLVYDSCWIDNKNQMNNDILPMLGKSIKNDDIKNIKNIIDDMLISKEYTVKRQKISSELWCEKEKATKNIVNYILSIVGDKNEVSNIE